MSKTTRLTQQDLQIYPSQRMTDTPDGGGRMVGQPLKGEDNEIFPIVSDVDRTMGSFDARLLYPAVLRDDKEPLYGGHFIISEPPKADNVSYLAFKARNYGETRQDIMPRIEAYSVPTIEGRMTMMGKHLAGVRLIQAYQRIEAPLPKVGERYCLQFEDKSNAQTVFRYEYFRIADLSHEVRTFEVPMPNGDVREIQRRVLKMEITNPLANDYEGVKYPQEGYAQTAVRILETQVADSAAYYGVKPVKTELKRGDLTVAVKEIYEKLVPTATAETPYADRYPVIGGEWVPAAPESAVYGLSGAAYPNDTLYLPHGVLPGSVKIDGYRDNGLGRLSGSGGASLSVDYERGMIQGVRGIYGLNVTAVPAAKVSNARHTAYIEIKDGNQGTAWAPLLQPAPAPGSLTVSYMSLGVWYGLSDAGDYILRAEDGTAAGTVSDTGSAVLTLPALPDVGSRIVLQWGDASNYRTFDAQASGKTPVVRQVSGSALVPSAPAGYIKPGSLRLSWNGKTAQDDKGRLKGQAQGYVDYMRGAAVVTGGLEAAPVTVSYQAYTGKEVAAAINDVGAAALDTRIGKTAPGSLQLALLYRASAAAGTARWVKAEYNNLSVGGNILAREKHDVKILADSAKYQGQTLIRLTDDGNGGLLLPDGTKLNGASIDYADGHIVIPDAKTAGIPIRITLKTGETATVAPGASVTDYDGGTSYLLTERTVTGVSVFIEQAAASRIADTAVRTVSVTETPSNLSASIYNGTQGGAPVFNTWTFEIGGVKIIERNGTLYRNWDYAKGTGEAVGRLTDGGEITFTAENLDFAALKITAGILAKNTERVYAYAGRTEAAPVKPESFTVYAVANGQTVSGRADADGHITGGITGSIHYETGFYQIAASDGLIAETLRYNAVTQDHIPLDSSIIGIDSVRLPADGRVPVFRKGDMVVIGNRLKQDLGQTFTGGQTIALARQNLDRACLLDAQGKHVSAEKYSIDLAAGKLTFAEPLSLAGHTLPLTAVLAWEEENRITAADVSGRLKLQTPLTRDYPKESTYVSSALVGGDLLVRATEPFAQKTWDGVWAEGVRGDPILARLNTANYPMALKSNGAVTERWLIRFTGENTYQLYGETLGLVVQGDTVTDLAPPNPATGKPYFTLPAAAFGGGWSAGNCIRFNTYGTPMPVWILRSVQPSAARQTEKDGFTACLRGNTVAE